MSTLYVVQSIFLYVRCTFAFCWCVYMVSSYKLEKAFNRSNSFCIIYSPISLYQNYSHIHKKRVSIFFLLLLLKVLLLFLCVYVICIIQYLKVRVSALFSPFKLNFHTNFYTQFFSSFLAIHLRY